MNRLDFVTNSVKYPANFESSVRLYFDQIMSLYNIFHDYDFKSIDGEKEARFTIKFKNKEDSKEAYDYIPGTVTMYDRVFSINKSTSRNNILVEMKEKIRE